MLLDRLAVEPGSYPGRKYYPRRNTGEPESFVIISEGNDIRDYVEDRIIIYEEGIGFPTKERG